GRKWPGEVLRLAMLMTHYREPIDFTVKRLEEAVNLLEKWERAAGDAEPTPEPADELLDRLTEDFDTPGAISRIHALILDEGRPADGLALAQLMGIGIKRQIRVDSDVADKIAARLAALNAKDFAEADRIRNELAEQGIALMDYKDETGQRATKWEVKR
ncbi:MAG: hypothetical protein ACK41V_23910, partial [Acidovorax sp.]